MGVTNNGTGGKFVNSLIEKMEQGSEAGAIVAGCYNILSGENTETAKLPHNDRVAIAVEMARHLITVDSHRKVKMMELKLNYQTSPESTEN